MSLNESPDCQIEHIIHADEIEVIAQVATTLKDEQMQYFSRNHDCLTTDLHSTKAGLELTRKSGVPLNSKGTRSLMKRDSGSIFPNTLQTSPLTS